ncbi:MAG TPA: NRAMP family divalent metal transporter [Ornithinimicrobium sp.]|uniref:NRAMP family divalent metal transporter n=1 Tax=Ornithinimicrobium sp. TaxID=1977084 RepID=UPI002B48EF65|nr:NRAMP family divalent metal transporter [Ornithinimicrobium sp.]HKJ12465.1 NRAMP family divalent metal transporter [Ornithinimicrobium sp.]
MARTDATISSPSSTAEPGVWAARLAALGPGILMASAAIGGSHLISSTQAGARFGWQLAFVVVLANLLKYPFFRFGPQYTMESGRSLVEGYAAKGRAYLWIFFALASVSSVISTAGVGLLCAVILGFMLPDSLSGSIPVLATVMMASAWLLLVAGHYRALDKVTKLIILTLTLATVVATFMAASAGSARAADFVEPSPWTWATLPFLVAIMGWMPAPIEISALNSLWIRAKQEISPSKIKDVLFDFNVGYVTSAGLALFFLALGALVQYGSGVEVANEGGAYVGQLLAMYGTAIGQWAVPLMSVIAFACMYGTVITVVDGYSRACAESLRLLRGQSDFSKRSLNIWLTVIAGLGLVIILAMSSSLAAMLTFAMISAFITAPIFAWLNFSLVRGESTLSPGLRVLSYAGLVYLGGFAVLFVLNFLGLVG